MEEIFMEQERKLELDPREDFNRMVFFCTTSLLLTSTRQFQTTIKLFTVHSLSTAQLLNLGNIKKFLKNLGNAENRTQAGWV